MDRFWVELLRPPRRLSLEEQETPQVDDEQPQAAAALMDMTKLAAAVDALARRGIAVDTDGLQMGDPNSFLEAIIGACHEADGSEQEYAAPEPANGPIMMSLGHLSIAGHEVELTKRMTVEQAVRAFEKTAAPRGRENGLTTTPRPW